MPKRVLVANRGEIACRIVQACHEYGCAAVAVFSDPDRSARHVRLADEAVYIGPASPAQSYLNQPLLLQVARQTGCDALHPGYGFLSENAEFAQAVSAAGITWIGPPPDAINSMGLKVESRETARRAQVPVVPGFEPQPGLPEEMQDRQLLEAGAGLGCPLLVKASAGGGGKGMRLVREAHKLPEAIAAARREAQAAFGNPAVYLEKYIERPHHIEIQLLADRHGNIVHLGERECSIQRRHQKIIEESPSPLLQRMGSAGSELRARLGESAVAVARAVGYESAGTVEFIVAEDGSYYFLEMNTRLQVEHPVTELAYGIDIVRWQLRIADGEMLQLPAALLQPRGHAIEARICAEDPESGFLPQTGRADLLRLPLLPGVRVDTALYEGWEVGPDYDSLLAKLIVWAADREAAAARLQQALIQFRILGLPTNLAFLNDLAGYAAFLAGDTHTGFVEAHMDHWRQPEPGLAFRIAAALSHALVPKVRSRSVQQNGRMPDAWGPWQSLSTWSNTAAAVAQRQEQAND